MDGPNLPTHENALKIVFKELLKFGGEKAEMSDVF